MVDIMELPKARVNASMLPQYIDRPVCFVGKLEKVRAGSSDTTGSAAIGEWLRGRERRLGAGNL